MHMCGYGSGQVCISPEWVTKQNNSIRYLVGDKKKKKIPNNKTLIIYKLYSAFDFDIILVYICIDDLIFNVPYKCSHLGSLSLKGFQWCDG